MASFIRKSDNSDDSKECIIEEGEGKRGVRGVRERDRQTDREREREGGGVEGREEHVCRCLTLNFSSLKSGSNQPSILGFDVIKKHKIRNRIHQI